MSDGAYTLGYWNIRGLAGPIRLAFAYAKQPLKEESYTSTMVDGKLQHNWADTYKKMKDEEHPFPNLPYLRFPDGKTIIVQSGAILRHIARAFDLYGGDAATMARVDEIVEEITDLRIAAVRQYYSECIARDFLEEVLPYYFGVFSRYIEINPAHGGFLCAATPTIADFVAYEVLRTAMPLLPKAAESYPRIAEFIAKIEAIPHLKEYFEGARHTLPANGVSANHK